MIYISLGFRTPFPKRWAILLGLFTALLLAAWFAFLPDEPEAPLQVALAGAMSGANRQLGLSGYRGISILLDEINAGEGVNGRKVVVEQFDDRNQSALALEKAREIADGSPSLAVIGHTRSSNAIAAGEIYAASGITAVAPGSSNVDVTLNNPWYFRVIFNDREQGRFLARYAKQVMGHHGVNIIQENLAYGDYLGRVFEKTARESGMAVRNVWRFKVGAPDTDAVLRRIVAEIQETGEEGLIFLSMHAEEGSRFVRFLRDAGLTNPLLAPQTFASRRFQEGFSDPKAHEDAPTARDPEDYTEGTYVTTPLIFDTANEEAQLFRAKYQEKYGEAPDWRAAFTYDAFKVIVEAMRKTGVTGTAETLAEDRRKIRDYLAALRSPEVAVPGATGLNWFDENGDCPKSISIGVYRSGSIISALAQLQAAERKLNFRTPLEATDAVGPSDEEGMIETDVVYTGIRINDVRELNINPSSCLIDFHLWFRCRDRITPQRLFFINAIEPVNLERPVRESVENGIQYRLYHTTGRFRTDFLPARQALGEHLVGISFRHETLTRNRLIYVSDVLGMRETDGGLNTDFPITGQVSRWSVRRAVIYQGTDRVEAMGNPAYLDRRRAGVPYSRFSAAAWIWKSQFSLRGLVSLVGTTLRDRTILYALSASGASLLFLIFFGGRFFDRHSKNRWFLTSVLTLVTMLLLEYKIINGLLGIVSSYNLERVATGFDILWWMVPAHLLARGLRPLLWNPIERRADRPIPRLIGNIINTLIYLFASFGVIAFVFHQELTGLLATSGLLAMIIGLAIQINISNIFSGLVINIERPFRIGDWVKIGDYVEGRVVDITWRTTRIVARDGTILGLPNSISAESGYLNYSMPDYLTERLQVHLDPGLPQAWVEKILLDAVLATDERVLKKPPPFAMLITIEDWTARYVVGYRYRDYGAKYRIRQYVWAKVRDHLAYAGVSIAIKERAMHMYVGRNEATEPYTPDEVLNRAEGFRTLPDDVRALMATKMATMIRQTMSPTRHGAGTDLMTELDVESAIFVITEGAVGVVARSDRGESVHTANLGVGDLFGGILFDRRLVALNALSEVEVRRIPDDGIGPFIDHPDFRDGLLRLSARRLNIPQPEDLGVYPRQGTMTKARGRIRNLFAGFFRRSG